ncbi:MAG: SPOR domain-containing protein [Alphaproteobacteria bacterium]|nr:SPOR domain-containing protein [Alphaproteobacteria bacterium]
MPQDERDPEIVEDVYDDLDEPPSRFSMMTGTLVAIGVAALLAFTGVLWYAFKTGADQAGQDALPVVHAEQGAVKVKPDDPGGASFAHQDKTVYDKIDGNEAGLEQLLPGAEEPKEKPRIISPYDNEMPEAGQPKVVRVAPPAADSGPAAPVKAEEVTAPEIPDPTGRAKKAITEGEEVAAAPPAEVNSATPEDADRVAAETHENNSAQEDTAPVKQAEPAAEMTAEKTAMATPASTTKGFVLQLGAFRSQEAADAGWKLLALRHAGVLGKLEHYVTPADLGEKGRFFRLQAGPFPERLTANEQCAALKTAGVDCLVAVR